jgi:REP-associated tyrosine transposase
MARANRHHLPGYVWHITHRCHKREFLLKFDRDKKRWKYWLFETKKRFGLCILNYCVTSNHIHLLVYDNEEDVIPKSIQLVAGRVGREYNNRKKRKGAYWEDRYHATAVMTGEHLLQCIIYIDLNMVRAGVVRHPYDWKFGGYMEIQNPKQRYSLINRQRLASLLGVEPNERLTEFHLKCVNEILRCSLNRRESKWTESIAVGDKEFIMETKNKLGAQGIGRKAIKNQSGYELKEFQLPYNHIFDTEKSDLRPENSYFWEDYNGIPLT